MVAIATIATHDIGPAVSLTVKCRTFRVKRAVS